MDAQRLARSAVAALSRQEGRAGDEVCLSYIISKPLGELGW